MNYSPHPSSIALLIFHLSTQYIRQNNLPMNRRYILLSSLIGTLSFTSPAHGQRAELADCIQTLSSDSIALYFDPGYLLAPVSCAAIRRVGRVDAIGNFQGMVLDYRLTDSSLLAQLTYQEGKATGPATFYFANGMQAAQGQMSQGTQNGEWIYWYPTGQRRQVLRYFSAGPTRIMAYWDSTGNQLAYNGSGQWQGLTTSGLQAQGTIQQGLPTGTWQGQHPANQQPMTVEYYEQGQFRYGRLVNPAADQLAEYRTVAMLLPQEPTPFLKANNITLGYNCNESTRRSQFNVIQSALRLPSVKVGSRRYADRLAQRLVRYRETHWYSVLPNNSSVRCTLDRNGKFTAFESDAPALREVVRQLVGVLPSWQAASYQNVPVPGYLDITLDKATSRIKVKASARLLTSQLPDIQPTIWP